jgi:hypothetical protein
MSPNARRVVIAVVALALAPFVIRTINRSMRNNSWQAQLTAIKSDLRNLADAEEAYFTRSGRYASSLSLLGDSAFTGSTGVRLEILAASDRRFEAAGTHEAFAPDARCTITLDQASSESRAMDCRHFATWAYRPRLAH